jgi:FKBP-type peptidyl-prolyl cis-trans isomerase
MNIMNGTRAISSLVLALAFATPGLCADEKISSLTDLQVSFKMDPRLTQGLYMGERWLSPATYTGTSGQDSVQAKVQGTDAKGKPVSIKPKWVPSDPEMVSVAPSEGTQVTITVRRPGESRVQVTSHGLSKELTIKAAQRNDVLQVEIAQSPAVARPAQEAPVQDEPKLKGEKERLGYAVGMNLGNAMRRTSVEADLAQLIQGLKDALSGGQTLLSEQEMRMTLVALQGELKEQQAARKIEAGEKNKKSEQAFFAENGAKDGVVTLASGVQYKVLKAGDGRKPAADDTVVFHYRGASIDGKAFDSSHKRKKPMTVALRKATKAWNEALQLMPVGSKWQLFIPSQLASAARTAKRGTVAPRTALVFEVELLGIKDNVAARQASAR